MMVVVDSSNAANRFTVGTLVTPYSKFYQWYNNDFMPWNKERVHPGQRLSYKDVRNNDTNLDELFEYVKVADRCEGLLLTVTFPSADKFVVTKPDDTVSHEDLKEFREWVPLVFERLFRTCCVISLAIHPITPQPARWTLLHDTDEIFEPSIRNQSSNYIDLFVTALKGEATRLALYTKDEIDDKLLAKAILGIPDVVAGGISSGLQAYKEKYGFETEDFIGDHGDLKSKDSQIALWMGSKSRKLRKIALSVEDHGVFLHQFDYKLGNSGDK